MSNFSLLDEQRRALDLSVSELTAAAGITPPTWRQLCRGRGTLGSLTAALQPLRLTWAHCAMTEPAEAGMALAARRRMRGLTQAEVARRAKCSRPTLIAIERRMVGQVRHFAAIVAALGDRTVLQVGESKRRALVPAPNAPTRDIVMTPPALAQRIVAQLSIPAGAHLLDPSRGQGAFFDAFPADCTKDWCELAEGRDFFDHKLCADWIITNPPWSILRSFLQHAMTLAENVVLVAPLSNFTTRARLADINNAGFSISTLYLLKAPKSWPQSGFQLVAAHIRKGPSQPWKIVDLTSVDDTS